MWDKTVGDQKDSLLLRCWNRIERLQLVAANSFYFRKTHVVQHNLYEWIKSPDASFFNEKSFRYNKCLSLPTHHTSTDTCYLPFVLEPKDFNWRKHLGPDGPSKCKMKGLNSVSKIIHRGRKNTLEKHSRQDRTPSDTYLHHRAFKKANIIPVIKRKGRSSPVSTEFIVWCFIFFLKWSGPLAHTAVMLEFMMEIDAPTW